MKRIFLLFAFYAPFVVSMAQTNIFESNGKVGIGISQPHASLDILSPNNVIQLRIKPVGGGNSVTSIPSVIDFFSTFDKYPPDQSPRRTASIKGSFSGGAWGAETLSFHVGLNGTNDVSSEPIERMRIVGNGNVGIGTANPREKLSVNGAIRAREIKVENSNWPDYVFDAEYSLPTLEEVEVQIRKVGHLSGMPSAKEVNSNGVNLGEMNAALLQKIEELTLYLIRMNKRNDEQQATIEAQGLAIEGLRSKID